VLQHRQASGRFVHVGITCIADIEGCNVLERPRRTLNLIGPVECPERDVADACRYAAEMNFRPSGLGATIRHVVGGLRKRAFFSLWEPDYLRHGYRAGAIAPRVMVTSPNQLSALAGTRILAAGGNAIDAAVAVGLADTVMNPHQHSLGGEATILIYLAEQQRVVVVNGNTKAPLLASIDRFRQRGLDSIPSVGLLAAGVPAMVDAWLTALDRFGTLSLAQVAETAISLAQGGYPLTPSLWEVLRRRQRRFRGKWRSSAAVYLPGGDVPAIGTLMVNGDLASTLTSLVNAERGAIERGQDRSRALRAARDHFYRGVPAEQIVRFSETNGGLLSREDLGRFSATVEESMVTDYRGYQVQKAGPWCQGPVLLQALNLLEGFDLGSMAPSGHDLIHTVVEAEKLAFADRERYYADPRFAEVPIEQLLSKEYADRRRSLIDPRRASMEQRPGDADRMQAAPRTGWDFPVERPTAQARLLAQAAAQGDTVHLDVVDAVGNVVSATASGGSILHSPVVEGLGFALGTRLQSFRLDPRHPNALAPGKGPRTTLSPTLVLRKGQPLVSLGSPGGDTQEQATLKALIHLVDFQVPIQEAFEAPMFVTQHFPSTFHPHTADPGALLLEGRIPARTEWQLRRTGHNVSVRNWIETGLLGIWVDPATRSRMAGVDPRPGFLSEWEVCGIGF
jgi:gamma-glutamyltranspeptidase / glutathione hydrolase